ncbi:MAG: GlsB/YeaQ/YmgE family stress response membrane protein [Planctomyces sp.]|jgi:uncharacterized membrane protein YeaQ/YmgE (transglycosylase-associated protein family)|nr:GlsB/YeaQ/YmgE family stress response membrane protein [Planctomyces sp.]
MFENIIDLFLWVIFGLVIGLIARFLVPGRQRLGMLLTIALGIAGSFAGGVMHHLLFGGGKPLQPSGIIMSIIGAVIVLLIAGQLKSRRG